MNKLTLVSLASVLSCSALVHAGGMGCNTGQMNGGAFFGLEGGYAQNNIDGYNFTLFPSGVIVSSVEDKQNYVFRLSAGMMNQMDDQFAVSGELGWGYYGKTSFTPSFNIPFTLAAPNAFTSSHTITGFDALVGMLYTQPSFNLYLKAGAMLQNVRNKTTANFYGFNLVDTQTTSSNSSAALPEIKVGGAYNFNENWALTVSYMYVFGGNPEVTGNFNTTTGVSNLVVDTENPGLSAAMIGLQVML